MKLAWNEIKERAVRFSKTWADESYEDGEAQTFLNEFFDIFGVSRKRVATFEKRVKKTDGGNGYIDLLWKGVILIEMKSRGKDLTRAFGQAKDYFAGLSDTEEPRYIMVCDFANIRLYDLERDGEFVQFKLMELHKKIKLFGFMAGYHPVVFSEQDPVNRKAAEKMGKLHDMLKACGYVGHKLEVYLVRLLFCLFADDSSIFDKNIFFDYANESMVDGSDLAPRLNKLFEVLNTPYHERMKTLNESLAQFPYVNGGLFAEQISMPDFNAEMRLMLLELCKMDWSTISPAIFGSMFQSVMDEKARRTLGAHYTSEKNIMKVIRPLFLDELYEEFEQAKGNSKRLLALQQKIISLKFLDPACGCGNFLVVTYRELRLLEMEILKNLKVLQLRLDITELLQVNVSQFYGIELEDFPALIAQTAMWLMDHQMNQMASNEFGLYYVRLPLKQSATIVRGNALTLDWGKIIPQNELSYIMGNPPFVGAMNMTEAQRNDMKFVFGERFKGVGELDYVAGWYAKTAQYMQGRKISAAFVSTNSICQGQQVALLWKELVNRYGISIHFAHKTFRWGNDARNNAAVYCIIVGFANYETNKCTLFEYDDVKDDASIAITVGHINGYLVNAPDIFIENRSKPLCDVPPMRFGSMPRGKGFFLSEKEKNELLEREPLAAKWIRRFVGAEEFLHNTSRYCLWLVGANPRELNSCPEVLRRVKQVREERANSTAAATRKLSATPTLFAQIAQPDSDYLIVPCHSSEGRRYIPIGFMNKDVICGNANMLIPNATLFEFGVLISSVHMAWMRVVCGRLKSDFRYSKDLVYNNFPWCTCNEKQRKAIEETAQAILNARSRFPDCCLADLYGDSMPPELVEVHRANDRVVMRAYGFPTALGEGEIVAELIKRYSELAK